MRRIIKEQIIDLLGTMRKSHEVILGVESRNQQLTILQDCQDAIEAISNELEVYMNTGRILLNFKAYKELIFTISRQDTFDSEHVIKLNESLDKVIRELSDFEETYTVVFFPYKSSMWDCMESIWKACNADKKCDCKVVPIPYYEFNSQTQEWVYCYEGNQLPEEIGIVDFSTFVLEHETPDIAYIHNPYDGGNRITSVHPNYYSEKLKQYVEKLVYVPYYMTSGFVDDLHLNLPAYKNVDHIIMQSKNAKEYFKNSPYYNKVLALGSPKIDKVINAVQNKPVLIKEWKDTLEGNKLLMLNTSIWMLLTDKTVYLDKINSIFKLVGNMNGIKIIWRPHPLLEATIKAMRPDLAEQFTKLKDEFVRNDIGVIDMTADLANTIALSDGYIGEESSSVINLFAAAGKPIFILNNLLREEPHPNEKRTLKISDGYVDGNSLWFSIWLYSGLFKMDLSTKAIEFIGRDQNISKWYNVYTKLAVIDKTIYLTSPLSTQYSRYLINENGFKTFIDEAGVEKLIAHEIVNYDKSIFYLPVTGEAIVEYNTLKDCWIEHESCIREFAQDHLNVPCKISSYSVSGHKIWISAEYSNQILEFNMQNGSYKFHSVNPNSKGFTGICFEEGHLWLTEINTGIINKWTIETEKLEKFQLPKKIKLSKKYDGRGIIFTELIEFGKYIVALPGFANDMIRIDKTSGEITMIGEEYWKKSEFPSNGYQPHYQLSAAFGKKLSDTHIMTQRMCDDLVAIIDIEKDTWDVFYPTLPLKEFEKMVEHEDGFEKIKNESCFVRRESSIFSLEGFMKDVISGEIEGVRERQVKEMNSLAENMDGTCGEKIHAYMMRELTH